MGKLPKESTIYLKYFQKNLSLIILPTLVSGMGGFIFSQQLPPEYHQRILYEVNASENLQKVILTDQIIAKVRQVEIQNQLGIDNSHLKIYNSGPYLINLDVANKNLAKSEADIVILSRYMERELPLTRLGNQVVWIKYPPILIYTLVSSGIGFILGNLIALIKVYIRNY